VHTTQGTVTADGKVFRRGVSVPGFTFPVKKTDQPCRQTDE
jgi:hypothetical protein